MAKQRHRCMFPNCVGEAINQIGIRLRRPPGPDNVWTHDTNAYLCDEHASIGLAFDINVVPHQNELKLWTRVATEMGETCERESDIDPNKLPARRP